MSFLTKAVGVLVLVALYMGTLVAVSEQSTSPTRMMMMAATSMANDQSVSGSVDSEADSGSVDLSDVKTPFEEVTVVHHQGNPRDDHHLPNHSGDHHTLYSDDDDDDAAGNHHQHQQHSVESWKKWTPPDDLLLQGSGSGTTSSVLISNSNLKNSGQTAASTSTTTNQRSHKVRSNCSNYSSSCHDCTRHGCNFMACGGAGRHTVCINGQTYILWKSANRCNRIDKCSAHLKRNSQQISSSDSDAYYLPGGGSSGGSNLSHEYGGKTKSGKSFRSNLHSRASNRFRQTNGSGSTPSSRNSNNNNSRLRGDIFDVSYFSRSGENGNSNNNHLNHNNLPKFTNLASGHEIRPSRSRYSKLNMGGQSVMPGRYVNHQVANSDHSAYYPGSSSSSSHRFGNGGGGGGNGDGSKSVKNSNKLRMPTIGIGTVLALMFCSSIVVSAVVTVAVKKIRKIYALNRSMSYGTLEEDH